MCSKIKLSEKIWKDWQLYEHIVQEQIINLNWNCQLKSINYDRAWHLFYLHSRISSEKFMFCLNLVLTWTATMIWLIFALPWKQLKQRWSGQISKRCFIKKISAKLYWCTLKRSNIFCFLFLQSNLFLFKSLTISTFLQQQQNFSFHRNLSHTKKASKYFAMQLFLFLKKKTKYFFQSRSPIYHNWNR